MIPCQVAAPYFIEKQDIKPIVGYVTHYIFEEKSIFIQFSYIDVDKFVFSVPFKIDEAIFQQLTRDVNICIQVSQE